MRDNISVLEENLNIQDVVEYLDENIYIYKGYIGFPNYYYDGEHLNIDAILITRKGVLAFVDESVNDVNPDDVYNKLDIVLRGVPALINRRNLIAKIDVFCLGTKNDVENYTFTTKEKVLEEYLKISNDYVDIDERKLDIIINAIEGCLVKEQKNRHTSKITSAIAKLENSISKYDNKQLECLKDYEHKVQVISGLAGSGKTVILCKKIAQLILNNNEANICITFFSRSLKKQIRNMIKSFLERTTDNVDFLLNKIEIVNSWGDSTGDGFYSSLCKELNINHIPYYVAKQQYKKGSSLFFCFAT